VTQSLYYFGYGSLVNRQTRDADESFVRATLHGWVRQWAHQARRSWSFDATVATSHVSRSGKGVCALTVAERPSADIDGVLVPIDRASLPQLDQRESGYDRVTLSMSALSLFPDDRQNPACPAADATVLMYVSSAAQNHWADTDYPLIISYIHCVMRGFEDQFGVDGLQRMMHSTDGWSLPLLDDRQAPIYPRAVTQSAEQILALDQCLAAHREEATDGTEASRSPHS